ncbi:hypothetical protein [Microvirga alba]|uniref:Uncharacterized protein n=1 Tax=Microvirga alba TaxID=2791025 RepID=A0A931FP88_9HYPH|nr:hypothetical protein [Microvirga alba]MBF9234754.1 hypothetical protein [Microvirga alba]
MPLSKCVAGLGLVLGLLPTSAFADFWTDNECTLAEPQPVFKNGKFRLDREKGIAYESIALNKSIMLQLEQTACASVSHTYTFMLKERPTNTNIVGWEYGKALELLSLLEARSDPRLRFTAEKKALSSYAQLVLEPKQDVDINIRKPHDQFYELISIASQIHQDTTKIIVKVSSGPY